MEKTLSENGELRKHRDFAIDSSASNQVIDTLDILIEHNESFFKNLTKNKL